ncbi:MAG: type II toxin-antitoxin system RelE/ParE family toxin [Candidatus Yanofskybacteria bacterium]|nr:type II toxin-antitoxin system RelE/ParE family toxin [Candidatus Yanofskybacteria bacterium]
MNSMVIFKTKDFEKELKKLPSEIKSLFKKQKTTLEDNWLDPRLHTKKIKEIPGVYSFRITRQYRVLFYFSKNNAIFFSIGHRKDIY